MHIKTEDGKIPSLDTIPVFCSPQNLTHSFSKNPQVHEHLQCTASILYSHENEVILKL